MVDVIETIQTLANKLENMQKNADEEANRNNGYFRKIMDKLDVLPTIQTSVAVMQEQLSNVKASHELSVKNNELMHAAQEKRLDEHEDSIKDLERSKWTVTGAAMAISGFISGVVEYFHKV